MATRTLLLTLAILVPFLPLGSCFGIGMLGVAALPHKGVIPEDSRAFGFTRSALPLQSAPWHSSNQQQQQQQQHVRVRKRHTPPTRSLLSHDGNHAAAAAVEARDLLPTETRLASANLSESEKKCLMWHDGLGKLNCHQFSLVFGNRRKLWIWQWWNKNEITVRGEHNIWKKDVLRCEGTKWATVTSWLPYTIVIQSGRTCEFTPDDSHNYEGVIVKYANQYYDANKDCELRNGYETLRCMIPVDPAVWNETSP